jgi:subtilisin
MNKLLVLIVVSLVVNLSFNARVLGVEKRFIIGFHKAPDDTERSMIESKQGKVKNEFEHLRAISVEIEESELPGLLDNPDVAYVEEDMIVQAIGPIAGTSGISMKRTAGDENGTKKSLSYSGILSAYSHLNAGSGTKLGSGIRVIATDGIEYENAWSVTHIGTKTAHGQSVTGLGVKIAILDTGIDYNHPDLDMNYSGGDNFISIDVNNHDPMDDSYNSHGTHVAGVIAAELDGAGVVGVSPDASVYAVKVLDGAGFGSVSAIVAGIEWAIANQMDIVNMSMGLSSYSQLMADACAAAEEAGILLVAAAGNNYGGSVLYPAAFPSVIAVGATTIDDEIAPISPIGPELEIVAPGLNIYSTVGGDGYGYLGGTSQAAPHISGLAALLLSAGIENDLDGDGMINSHDIRLLIQNSASDLGVMGFDEIYGFGLVNVTESLAGSKSGDNPITHLTIEKKKCSQKKCSQMITIEDGVYDVTIVNTSLHALKMLVFEDKRIRHDLSDKFRFIRDANQTVSVSLDATETTYKLVFLPRGKNQGLADIYVQKQ